MLNHRSNSRTLAVCILASIAGTSAAATPPFTLTVQPASSSITATLTVSGATSADTSTVGGTAQIALDVFPAPELIELYDFDLQVLETLNFSISIPFGGATASATNLAYVYETPGFPQGPVAIAPVTGAFTFPNVPALPSGTANYNATGLLCILLGSQTPPVPCNDTIDLSQSGVQTTALPGAITFVGRAATLNASIDVTTPLDPANPALGSMRVVGNIRATGNVPCPGDFDGDGSVGVPDIFAFLAAWFAMEDRADLDGTPGVGVPDIFAFLSLWFAPCV